MRKYKHKGIRGYTIKLLHNNKSQQNSWLQANYKKLYKAIIIS